MLCRRNGIALTCLLLLASWGCSIPAYRMPSGFSSSYHQAIYGDQLPPDWSAEPTADPSLATNPGVFYPPTAQIARDDRSTVR